MKKILHIIHGLNVGGAETFIFNLLQNINTSQFCFDFAIQNPHIGHTQLKELIQERGGKIFRITDFRKNFIKEYCELKTILGNGYQAVHIHMNAFVNPIPAIVASQFNNKVIIHSHNTHNGSGGAVARYLHFLNRKLFMKSRFLRIACGTEAGKWMFVNQNFQVVNNAVNLSKFKYNPKTRQSIREKYGLTDELIIGHMGRFAPEKNQKFLLEVFLHIKFNNPLIKVKLMLCGDGTLKEDMINYSRVLKIDRDVIFTGNISCPENYYSAFDCFILPSWFEGLAFVAIEAQAAGLKVIASDTNTQEIDVTGNVVFLSLKDNPDKWSKTILNALEFTDRKENASKLCNSKYDLDVLVDTMSKIYSQP